MQRVALPGAADDVPYLPEVSRDEKLHASLGEVLRELGEHPDGAHVEVRHALGVEDDRVGVFRMRADVAPHPVRVRKEQPGLWAKHDDTRDLLVLGMPLDVRPLVLGARRPPKHGDVRPRRAVDEQQERDADPDEESRQGVENEHAEEGRERRDEVRPRRDLAEAGFVQTSRGAGGGLRLARPAEDITLGEVVRALDRGEPLVECFRADGGTCVLTPHCRLKDRLAAARQAFLRELDATTLAECVYPSREAA